MVVETRTRSFLKALTWRVTATLTTALIVLGLTDDYSLAFTVGAIETVAKLAVYFFHERLWRGLVLERKPPQTLSHQARSAPPSPLNSGSITTEKVLKNCRSADAPQRSQLGLTDPA